MPFRFEPEFTRQAAPKVNQVGLVIPDNAEVSSALAGEARRVAESLGPPTVAPGKFSFHYVEWPPHESLLADGAEVDTGIFKFKVKDAVVGVFDLARWSHDEFCWSFSSSAQRDVLAALRVGQTFDVQLAEPLEEAFHVLKYHFPSGVPDCGYGEYAIHLAVDDPRPDGFRVTSAFEPASKRTDSRLPFFFGFRVFGAEGGAEPLPVWRTLLAAAVLQTSHARWAHSLLYAAFGLEAFIDQKLAGRLRSADLGEEYIDHVLRVADRSPELSALNSPSARLSKSGLRSLSQRLNEAIFTPRNRLAHGRLTEREIAADMAVNALKTTVDFVWDWEESSCALLLTPMRSSSFEALIDDALLDACRNED
jgi:hypothetical protein